MGIGQIVRRIVKVFKSRDMVPVTEFVDKDNILQDKIALISGGSGGIGYSIAKSFIASGAKVVIAGTNEKKLQQCCEKLGECSQYIELNLQDVSSFDSKLEKAVNAFPEKKLHILVNAAGRINNNNFFNTEENEWDEVIDVNLKGTYFLCQKVSRYLVDNKIKGHILNVSSSSALRPAWTPYQISKWAIDGFTRGLADTLLKYGIIVNAIAPGPTATPMLGFSGGGQTINSKYRNPVREICHAVRDSSTCSLSCLGLC